MEIKAMYGLSPPAAGLAAALLVAAGAGLSALDEAAGAALAELFEAAALDVVLVVAVSFLSSEQAVSANATVVTATTANRDVRIENTPKLD
ncbi:MAG: hypothetical protein ABIM89_00685 [Mycobacteriales bacterium]